VFGSEIRWYELVNVSHFLISPYIVIIKIHCLLGAVLYITEKLSFFGMHRGGPSWARAFSPASVSSVF